MAIDQDAYRAAFCDLESPEVFHAIQHKNDIWKPDPFDVVTIHEEARSIFARLCDRLQQPRPPAAGSILLLKGYAGSGKTHLMRACRSALHAQGRGYFGYVQLTTRSDNYTRYLLRGLVASLDQPYHLPDGPTSGMQRLSNEMVLVSPVLQEKFPDADMDAPTALREFLTAKGSCDLINRLVPILLTEAWCREAEIDPDIVRAMLFLQTGDAGLHALVSKYLHCDRLTAEDEARLGGIVSRHDEFDAEWMFVQLGRLMWHAGRHALVLSVDQLEDVYNLQDAESLFRRAMTALRGISDAVPSSILLIACLDDYYVQLREHLTRSLLDRIEQDPAPIMLSGARNAHDIRRIVAQRLEWLYALAKLPAPEDPCFPFPPDELERLAGMRTRDILDACRRWREACMDAGALVEFDSRTPAIIDSPATDAASPVTQFEQEWNDFVSAWPQVPPADEDALARILALALEHSALEFPDEGPADVHAAGNTIGLEREGASLLIGICNRRPQGGGLTRQVQAVRDQAVGGQRVIILRSTEFPRGARTQIADLLGQIVAGGGQRLVVQNSEWRALMAMEVFRAEHGRRPGFTEWLRRERPLSRLHLIQTLLEADRLTPLPAQSAPPSRSATAAAPASAQSEADFGGHGPSILLGRSDDGGGVLLDPEELTRHAAFLGGTGSGKTTLALRIVEHLLAAGYSAVLVDRKGDLCGYAAEAPQPGSPHAASFLGNLRRKIDVAVYTPGHPEGRPLILPLLPDGMAMLSEFEQDKAAAACASSLGAMMNFSPARSTDQACYSLLKMALLVLGRRGVTVTLQSLTEAINQRDPEIQEATAALKQQTFDNLANLLGILQINKGKLIEGPGELADAGVIFGGDGTRPRLSIISTKFLTDAADIEFWVAQWLLEVGRWISRSPGGSLQAVMLLDEADLYLPAQRKPATKEPMEDLLRRARSAGLGLMLATQSPGDLDYRCRENIRLWCLGRIKEDTALRKVRPMLQEADGARERRLPNQEPGHFVAVREGQVQAFEGAFAALPPKQLPEATILQLARTTRPAAYSS